MIQIQCPWCGLRDELEFTWGDEVHGARPRSPEALPDAVWVNYLYFRNNLKGTAYERWCHTYGCRQWFNVLRDTATHRIQSVSRLDEAKAEVNTWGG